MSDPYLLKTDKDPVARWVPSAYVVPQRKASRFGYCPEKSGSIQTGFSTLVTCLASRRFGSAIEHTSFVCSNFIDGERNAGYWAGSVHPSPQHRQAWPQRCRLLCPVLDTLVFLSVCS